MPEFGAPGGLPYSVRHRMRYWRRPSFWIVLIFGEFLAYLLAAYSTLLVVIILIHRNRRCTPINAD